jgi:hypothetical protein
VVQKQPVNSAWAFPVIGAFAMVSCVSLAVALRKKSGRTTRQITLVDPVSVEDGLLEEGDSPVE